MVSFSSQGLQKVDIQEHFLIVKELGEGGFGKIFLAHNRNTGQRMALKVIDKNRSSQRSFLREFSISFLLSVHPSIIECCGSAFTTTDHFVFAQELAPLGDLLSMIIPNVGIPEHAVKRCAVQISSALEFMAAKGLVHMDVKPDNVLVFDQDCHSIKLTDFGLAKVKGTVIRGMCGTTSFMAQEMCKVEISDGLVADGSLDVWSFGVVIYCLLTGELPWEDAIPEDVKYKRFVEWQSNFQMHKFPETLTKVGSGIWWMLGDLWAIDCTKRCQPSEVLKYLSESWKAETIRQGDEDPIEKSYYVQSHEPLCEASHLNTSQDSDTTFRSTSGHLVIDTSVSEFDITPEPQKYNMAEALIVFD
ncbi:serine/threonine-protein kinase SBK1-like [Rana temporaria]|uniref:serine/threonine-protein kinase SBK1-like n=1 Tax=Rana temporaria TaxID=8407 RepID=UPI001AADB3E7|nr:serine/threonine-protein kinase SBK1-like [Rana temporaria]